MEKVQPEVQPTFEEALDEKIEPVEAADKPDQPASGPQPDTTRPPAPDQAAPPAPTEDPSDEVLEAAPADPVEQVASKVKALSLKKTDEEEPSISHSELVNNLPADSKPKDAETAASEKVPDEPTKEQKVSAKE